MEKNEIERIRKELLLNVNIIDAKILEGILTDNIWSAVIKSEKSTLFADYQWMCRVQQMDDDELFKESIRIFESIENSTDTNKMMALNYVCKQYEKVTYGESRFHARYISLHETYPGSDTLNESETSFACMNTLGSCLISFIGEKERYFICEFKLDEFRFHTDHFEKKSYRKRFDKPVMCPINKSLKWKATCTYDNGKKQAIYVSADNEQEALTAARYLVNAHVHPGIKNFEICLVTNDEFVQDLDTDTDVCLWTDFYDENNTYVKSRTSCGCQTKFMKGMNRCYKCGRKISRVKNDSNLQEEWRLAEGPVQAMKLRNMGFKCLNY